jgi:hypothetical protein
VTLDLCGIVMMEVLQQMLGKRVQVCFLTLCNSY